MVPKLYDDMMDILMNKACPTCGETNYGLIDQQTIYCKRCHPEYNK